ncbi:ammonium transporter AmtB-like domain-containing protein [Jimgerdemannia flammicorona]|uniref:Ammonium transporter n=1 Tax=Jimgerdemannia flammicorona TaxID=994334 RepID=A0A433R0G6_9FUNG|nr:ammonium transporter AmtB-like domain-containing protein [Jimgerdemannia flammicorona]
MMSNLSTPTPPPFCVCRYIGQHGPRVPDVPRTGFLLRWTRQDKKCTLTHVPHGPECWRGFAPAHVVLRGVGRDPYVSAPTIPASVFMVFQMMFACITPALAFGAAAERTSLGSAIVFLFVWSTLVYDIVTCWVWGPHGWLALLGVMDYAGGTPVHIASGAAAVAYALVLGKRKDAGSSNHTPHNVSFVFLGLALLWFGWFGFNGGSALAANARSVQALINTHMSGCVGGMTWVLIDWGRTRKWSIVGFCTGAVAGLATITPGAGFVSTSSSLVFGFVGAVVCNFAVACKKRFEFDDALDVFAIHYVGGFVGLTITGIFAERAIIGLSYNPGDVVPSGGCLDGQCIQILIQFAAIGTVSGWSFFITYAILWIMDKIPGLHLRLRQGEEELGTDLAQMGEHAYGFTLETKNPVDSNRRRTILSFFREAPLVLEKTKEEGPEE